MSRFELRPEDPAEVRFPGTYPLDPQVYSRGRVVSITELWPGDIILSQDLGSDWVSNGISRAQLNLGYAEEDAKFTHAMMYVGARHTIIESTFDFEGPELGWGEKVRTCLRMVGKAADKETAALEDPKSRAQGVFISDLNAYSNHVLRCRRSRRITSKDSGWNLVANALALVKCDYDFDFIRMCAEAAAVRQPAASVEWTEPERCSAVVCSTLIAQAIMGALQIRLGETFGVCTPSFLSSDKTELVDQPLRWAAVGKHVLAPA